MPKFNEYVEGGYWLHREDTTLGLSSFMAVIKLAHNGWYGGAAENGAAAVPLHGPYLLKITAKRKALSQLALLHEDDQ